MLKKEDVLKKKYKIIKQIGHGGFGITYLSRIIDTISFVNSKYVVKEFSPQTQDLDAIEKGKELFQREAETLERLGKHDQIPTIFDYFEENKQFYIVQEFIDGHDLTQEINYENWDQENIIKLLREILEVLNYIHQSGIIHRDLKPSNIRRRTLDGKIVIIDFGGVKEYLGLSILGNTTKNQYQNQGKYLTIIESPGYTPKEQKNGLPNQNKNCDIYAVGIIAIQILTKTEPQNLTRDAKGKIKELEETNRKNSISDDLREVLNKMVDENYCQRYQTGQKVLDALNEV